MHSESTSGDHRRAWLVAALRGDRPPWNATTMGAADILDAAHAEGVSPLLDDALQRFGNDWGIPPGLMTASGARMRKQVGPELMLHLELVRVLEALGNGGIPVLLLKGAALAYGVYPAPNLRPRCDSDLLFADADAVERSKSILADLGYAASAIPTTIATAYQIGFHREAPNGHIHWIDAHWALANNAVFAKCFGFDEMSMQAVAIPALGVHARRLGTVHALLHACIHRVANLPSGEGDRLIWLYDIDLLLRGFAPHDFDELLGIVRQRGLAGSCLDAIGSTVAAFATPLPDGLPEELAAMARGESFDVRKAHNRTYLEWQNLRTLPMRTRWSWAREKLFPDPGYMHELHASQSRWSLGWSYLRRLGNGLRLALRGSDR